MTFPSSRRSLSAPRPRHVFSAMLLAAALALTKPAARRKPRVHQRQGARRRRVPVDFPGFGPERLMNGTGDKPWIGVG